MNDARVSLYREAVEALRDGQLDINIPVGEDDVVSELGQALRELAETLKAQSEQSAMLSKITQKINEGLLIDEVLDQIYENFFSLIPYDRIGLALLDESQAMVKSFWAGREFSTISPHTSMITLTRTRRDASSRRGCVRV